MALWERLGHPVKITNKNARRARLWVADPRCAYCGIVTVWPEQDGGTLADDAATLEHLHSRLHPKRSLQSKPVSTVLACRLCNWSQGREEVMARPLLERQLAGQWHRLPKHLRPWPSPWQRPL